MNVVNGRPRRTYYRFINRSRSKVKVYWLMNLQERTYYNSLEPGQFLDVNTFPDHFWLFEKDGTGDHVLADGACLFASEGWTEYMKTVTLELLLRSNLTGYVPRVTRKLVTLEEPLHSLRHLALQAVRDLVTINDVDSLQIPTLLKEDVKRLLMRKICASSHGPDCSMCPFELHQPHNSHVCKLHQCLATFTLAKPK